MILVAGTLRVLPEAVESLRPAMLAMIAASRAELGCITYAYGHDLTEPGLVWVSESWVSQAGLDEHFKMLHMAVWRAALAAAGPFERRLSAFEVVNQTSL
jgi:quinol monooxygenase YgiN